MIDLLMVNFRQVNMLLRRSLRIRLRCLNEKKEKKKTFKINERDNMTIVFHYNKNDIIEYFKEMKEICKENIINRRQIKLDMLLESKAAIKRS